MQKTRFIIIVCVVSLISISGWFVINSTTASPQGPMPGTGPINDEASAIAVGKTVALAELARDVPDAKVLPVNVQKLNESEFAQELTANGDKVDVRSILGSEPNLAVWSVTFSGAFLPRRAPNWDGTKTTIYAKINIFLSGKDGSVIGVHMYEEMPPK